MINKILSGGQTGADRGGLDAAIVCGVPHDGWCPKGRKAEDGIIPDCYHLKETESGDYAERTEANVRDADATVVFSCGKPVGGSMLTVECCKKLSKPCLVMDLDSQNEIGSVKKILDWLEKNACPGETTLNIAGSRESLAPGIHERVLDIMVMVLRTN